MYVFFSTRWAPPECYTYSLTPSLHDVLPVSVDRRGGEAVLAVHRPAPDRRGVERRHRASFERGQRFVNIDDRRARHDPLDRDAPVAFAQPRENRVLDAVERREVDMPALGRLDALLTAVAPDMRVAVAGARTDDGERPSRKRVGQGQSGEVGGE